ncbi:hypothetical protein BV25DRAFT_1838603 [Artomyces pyxidatus]|uniref:Uncharacterized protein n=1 Tax=Artomyces pyxidatus TaxID=48021 RepID=A0ACB8T213_9AGAM|nr:hypothetical protein BV25DRAFT_1838603 [Artomyces pyxidatus]
MSHTSDVVDRRRVHFSEPMVVGTQVESGPVRAEEPDNRAGVPPRIARIDTGYRGEASRPTEYPYCFWRKQTVRPGGKYPLPDKLTVSPYDQVFTIAIAGYVSNVLYADETGLPTTHVYSTFTPVRESDREYLYAILDRYSHPPEGFNVIRSPTSDIRVDRYLPDDSHDEHAEFSAFPHVFDGRGGYFLPNTGRTMPRISLQDLAPHDLAVYAMTVDRYWLDDPNDALRWTAHLKMESITLLVRPVITSVVSAARTEQLDMQILETPSRCQQHPRLKPRLDPVQTWPRPDYTTSEDRLVCQSDGIPSYPSASLLIRMTFKHLSISPAPVHAVTIKSIRSPRTLYTRTGVKQEGGMSTGFLRP